MRNREMKSINSLLGQFLQQFSHDREKTELFLTELWAEIVGDQLSQRTQPLTFRKGELRVAVAGNHWKKELEPLAESLSETINQFWGIPLVKRVLFVVRPDFTPGPGKKG